MAQESLINYIKTQVSNGQQLNSLTQVLLKQGFLQQQIDEAYAQLGYSTSSTKKNLLPVITVALAILVLVILGMFILNNKNKSRLVSSSPNVTPSTSQPTPGLTNCSLPARWTSTVGTTFKATTYLKPVSSNICKYTDSLLGYTIQYPANWYMQFSPAQPYNIITFDSQQLSASTNSPLAVSIYITPSKTNYVDIIDYMKSIQKAPLDKSYQQQIEKNVYQPITIAGQKAVQMHYTLGNTVGTDTKFIYNGVLYDVTFNGTSGNAINTNKQYYTNLLNSFTFKLSR